MTSFSLHILLSMLDRRGIITKKEKDEIQTVGALMALLISSSRIAPLSEDEQMIVSSLEGLDDIPQIEGKLDKLRNLRDNVEEEAFKTLIGDVIGIVEKGTEGD